MQPSCRRSCPFPVVPAAPDGVPDKVRKRGDRTAPGGVRGAGPPRAGPEASREALMFESFTAGALRAMRRAEARARARSGASVDLIDLAAALADESESRASALLAAHGLAPERLLEGLGLGGPRTVVAVEPGTRFAVLNVSDP